MDVYKKLIRNLNWFYFRLLDNNFDNINKYSNEIVILYYDILMKNNTHLNFDKITIEIIHNNGKKSRFDYSYEDIKEITKLN